MTTEDNAATPSRVDGAADNKKSHRAYAYAAMASLVYTFGVILWGAYVRVSLSGDGCGDEWPFCGGRLIPLAPDTERLIEFTHRATSALSGFFVLLLLIIAWRVFPKKHAARRSALWSFVFMLSEGLIGALIVKLSLVAENPSITRAYGMIVHLLNTNVLIAFQFLLILDAHPTIERKKLSKQGYALCIALLIVGASGVIAALGDTIFPAESFSEGFAQDWNPNAHLFLRLRTFHPLLAVGAGALCIWAALRGESTKKDSRIALAGFAIVQLLFGTLNLVLNAPAISQLIHLLLADLLWLSVIYFGVIKSFATSKKTIAITSSHSS